jgi:hypothetical protein
VALSELSKPENFCKEKRAASDTARLSFWLVFCLAFALWWLHQTAKTASECTCSLVPALSLAQ